LFEVEGDVRSNVCCLVWMSPRDTPPNACKLSSLACSSLDLLEIGIGEEEEDEEDDDEEEVEVVFEGTSVVAFVGASGFLSLSKFSRDA
jgi:hypothetical protein